MSTLITNNPTDRSPDDDPTGVRDLLSALPQPAPMPAYLVERINASLAAEQAQRAAAPLTTSVSPLLSPRRRARRVALAVAGAAAAVALFAAVGSNLFQPGRSTTVSGVASAPIPSPAPAAGGKALSDGGHQATRQESSGPAATPALVQIRVSPTRYTQSGFAAQARDLHGAVMDPGVPPAAYSAQSGPAATTPGLIDCLNAIGAGRAQMVRADLAFYEGRPAVIIVATTNGARTAYAVGRQCSHTDAAVLRPATPLP